MELMITSVFEQGGWIPPAHLLNGGNASPPFVLHGIDPNAKSLAIVMEQSGGRPFGSRTRWLLWNLPVQGNIPAGVPAGKWVKTLGGASQGGLHSRYQGPRANGRRIQAYRFTVFTVDCRLALKPCAHKKELLRALRGHILQRGVLTGVA